MPCGVGRVRLAVEQVVVPLGRPVELLPRTEEVRAMQADLVERHRLRSDVWPGRSVSVAGLPALIRSHASRQWIDEGHSVR